MSDSNAAGDTAEPTTSDSAIRIRCLGVESGTLDRLQSEAGDLDTSFDIRETSDIAGETGMDCLVVADGAAPDWEHVESLDCSVVLFTAADPVELSEPALSAVDTIVMRRHGEDGSAAERRLAEKIVAVTTNRQATFGDGDSAAHVGDDSAAFLVDGSGHVQWSSHAFEELFPATALPARAHDADSLYERLAFLLRDTPSDLHSMLELPDTPDRRDGTVLTVDAGETRRHYRHYSYPLEQVDATRIELFQEVTDVADSVDRLTLFEELVDNAEDGLFVLDSHGDVVYLNHSFAEMLGYEPEELLGANATKAIPPEEFERGREVITNLLNSGGGSDVIDLQLQRKDGEMITGSFHFSVRHTDDGELAGTMGVVRDVTARRERERELERYEAIVESMTDAALVVDADKQIEFANEEALAYLDEPLSDLVGTSVRKKTAELGVGSADRRKYMDALENALDPDDGVEYPIRVELELELPVGTHVGEFNCSPLVSDGEPKAVVIARDISERKEREWQLEQQRERLSVALSGSNAGVWEWDPETDEVVWHDTCERLFGLAPGEFDGTFSAFTDRIHEDDRHRFDEAVDKAVSNREPFEAEFRIRRVDGEVLWTDARAEFVDVQGLSPRYVGVITDITELKERERELERFQTTLKALGDPVCTFDADGRIRYVNGAFEEQTGYDADDAYGENAALVMSREAAEQARTLVEELAADGTDTGATFEMDLETSDGDVVPTECHLALLPTEGDDCRSVAVMRDISRRKRREQRLTQFASVVSHDLRNPMDVALGRAEVLPEIADVDEETEKHLDEIFNSLKRMEHLIEDVLTLTRQRDEEVNTASVSLGAVARDAWSNVETDAATLSVEADGEILAHRSRFLRLLENLFRNAVEHGSRVADDAGPELTVTVGTLGTDAGVPAGFYVADDGAGIPDDAKDKVFDDGFSTDREGTGLGLAIVREIALAHGWDVNVADSETGGARFEFAGVEAAE